MAAQFGVQTGTADLAQRGMALMGGMGGSGAPAPGMPSFGAPARTPPGAVAAPEVWINAIRENTQDPTLRDNTDFIRVGLAILLQESGFYPRAENRAEGSMGGWQIHPIHGLPDDVRLDPVRSTQWRLPELERTYSTLAAERPQMVGTPQFAGDVAQRVQRAYEGLDANGRMVDPKAAYAQRYVEIGPISLGNRAPSGIPGDDLVDENDLDSGFPDEEFWDGWPD